MRCQRCAGEQFVKAGFDRAKRQMHRCTTCRHRQTVRSASAFCGYRFPDDLIALAVRWYLRFRLPYADIVELLAERGAQVDASTVFDWVQRFTPLYKDAARPHRHRVGTRWAVDETYIRLAGRWVYAYRAIDEHGQVIDVYLSETRDTVAATPSLSRRSRGPRCGRTASQRTKRRPIRPRCGPSYRKQSTSPARWSSKALSAIINTSKGGRGVCAASSSADAPRWCATATASCATCATVSTA